VHPQTLHNQQGPASRDGALGQYLRAMRSRRLLVCAITLLTVLTTGTLLARSTASYEATAQLLVTPLPQDDRAFLGINLLRDSGDPTRTVQTAATTVTSPEAARQTARAMGGGLDGPAVEQAVKVEPLGESNVIAVTGTAGSAQRATALANTYLEKALEVRGDEIERQLRAAISVLARSAKTAGDRERLLELRAVAAGGDPTLRVSREAEPPAGPTGRPKWLALVLALIAGIVLGAVAAVLMERFDRRVRDVAELLDLWPLPILARVPRMTRRARRTASLDVAAPVREAFRTLQIQLDQRTIPGRVVMVTSASRGDGKTSSALNLSLALVGAGHRVILMDFDLRKPDVERRLGLDASRGGLMSLLTTQIPLDELLRATPTLAPLRVFSAAGGSGDALLLQALSRRTKEIFDEAGALADYVVIDTAPLGEVGDALPVAPLADDVLLIGRPGNTDVSAVRTTRDLLTRAGVVPSGWIVLADEDAIRSSYYQDVGFAAIEPRLARRARVGVRSVIG
jgi:Mrp family chromosome partitioning ATPase/capsular polysaccharide biosynthesis protein